MDLAGEFGYRLKGGIDGAADDDVTHDEGQQGADGESGGEYVERAEDRGEVPSDDEGVGIVFGVEFFPGKRRIGDFGRVEIGIDDHAEGTGVFEATGDDDCFDIGVSIRTGEFREVGFGEMGGAGGEAGFFVPILEEGLVGDIGVGAESLLPFKDDFAVLVFHLVGEDGGGFTDGLIEFLVESLADDEVDR